MVCCVTRSFEHHGAHRPEEGSAACWLMGIAAFITGWAWLAGRYPAVAYLTGAFFNGFIGGAVRVSRRWIATVVGVGTRRFRLSGRLHQAGLRATTKAKSHASAQPSALLDAQQTPCSNCPNCPPHPPLELRSHVPPARRNILHFC